MRDRIFDYLKEAGRSAKAEQILKDLFKIQSSNALSSGRILAGVLRDDPRFIFKEGVCYLRSKEEMPAAYLIGHEAILYWRSSENIRQNFRAAICLADGRCREFSNSTPMVKLGRLLTEIEGRILVAWSSRELRLWNKFLWSNALEVWRGGTFFLRNLAARVLKKRREDLQFEDLAQKLGLSPPDEENSCKAARYLNECKRLLLEGVPKEFLRDLESLCTWIDDPKREADFSRFAFGRQFLRQLPDAPGVYLMKNHTGSIIYVGKSRSLRRRVSSYFTPRALGDPKTARIHKHLYSVDAFTTGNEIEALLMEMRMIKDFRPPVNLQTEIRERQTPYPERRNLLLFSVDAGKNGVQIYFLRNGIFAGRLSSSLGRAPSKRLCAKIKSLFFVSPSDKKRREEDWEKEIIRRWFAANQKRLNYLDVDRAGDYDSVLKLLHQYLNDPDKLMHKVYYR
jgi:hypothetical protein